MAEFKRPEDFWSPSYKQEVIDYVDDLEQEITRLKAELRKFTHGASEQPRKAGTTQFASRNGNSKAQNVKLCYNLYHREQYNKKQIADKLGVSVSTVSRYLTLANEELAARSGAYSPQARELARKKRQQEREEQLRKAVM